VTEVWLVRHTTVDVPAGTCYGRTDVALRETFAVEAAEVRHALAGVRFDEVWSSPRSRCTRLAAECGFADARLDPRLAELDFGEWEGRRWDEIDDPALDLWYADYLHARPTGGETFAEQRARVAEFLDELRTREVGFPDGRSATHPAERPPQSTVAGTESPFTCAPTTEPTAATVPRRVLVFTHGGVMVAAGLHAGLFDEAEAFSRVPAHGTVMKIAL